ncbi:MAG: GTPase HflX [Candidatus Omnitrophica bacterium]|nr:GTPase HflX [Candidatus Omnitrophota bacterium]
MYNTAKKEKAILILVEIKRGQWSNEVLAQEFRSLVLSAGIEVEDLVMLKRKEIYPRLYIGKGNVEELTGFIKDSQANVVIFNNNLSFNQQRNLEEAFGVKTIDRTQLILDIFAACANTQEGRLEVELAQLQYLKPRLRGKGTMMSRLGGGIGTLGPGETKLEVDQRKISERIIRLKREIKDIRQHRQVMRKKRQKQKVCVCSLVGYTNAGKSTLFNALTESTEKVSSRLFTTLDAVSHSFLLHGTLNVILSDTVGFIYDLPPYLVEAFKATLEELQFADVLLHVVDASSADIERMRESVDSILEELSLNEKPIVLVFNKIDNLKEEDLSALRDKYFGAIFISAKERINLDQLREELYKHLFEDMQEVIVRVPFSMMEAANYIHKNCEVIKVDYKDEDAVYLIKVSNQNLSYLTKKGFEIEPSKKKG